MGPSPATIPMTVSSVTMGNFQGSGADRLFYLTLGMTDNLGFGKEKRRGGNLDVLAGRSTFRWVR
jgi:hypothetical protein